MFKRFISALTVVTFTYTSLALAAPQAPIMDRVASAISARARSIRSLGGDIQDESGHSISATALATGSQKTIVYRPEKGNVLNGTGAAYLYKVNALDQSVSVAIINAK